MSVTFGFRVTATDLSLYEIRKLQTIGTVTYNATTGIGSIVVNTLDIVFGPTRAQQLFIGLFEISSGALLANTGLLLEQPDPPTISFTPESQHILARPGTYTYTMVLTNADTSHVTHEVSHPTRVNIWFSYVVSGTTITITTTQNVLFRRLGSIRFRVRTAGGTALGFLAIRQDGLFG